MSDSKLPERASLEYLKKKAKARLRELRLADSKTKLSTAQLSVAREYGFSSWRALKAEIEQLSARPKSKYFEACAKGEIEVLRILLANDPALALTSSPGAPFPGWTGLHEAAKRGHTEVVRLLLAHGADPNAREAGDNTYPLHWAAAHRDNETVRTLLDAGGDVHGEGDLHALGVIGWATYFRDPGRPVGDRPETAALLVKRGARHHVFSAMSVGDVNLLQAVVERNPAALERKMSRFEEEQTPLHFAISIGRHDMLRLLIEIGANLEARDKNGLTPLESAMMRGDQEAMALLTSAGAKKPKRARARQRKTLSKVANSVTGLQPMIYVPDVAAALNWYVSIGFKELARFEDDGLVNFGIVALGKAEILINMNGKRGDQTASLWFSSDQVDEAYNRLKSRQIGAASAGGAGDIDFVEHINDTFYGARQFGIRDPNGYLLYFIQQLHN